MSGVEPFILPALLGAGAASAASTVLRPTPPAPPAPKIQPPAPMPDDDALKRARQRELTKLQSGSGSRASTVLTGPLGATRSEKVG